jgi:hypothetical protein
MSTADQRDKIEGAIAQLQNAEADLLHESFECSDPVLLGKLKAQSDYVAGLAGQLVHTRLIADDDIFAKATATIKQTADHLNRQARSIRKIGDAIKSGAKIAGYLAGAAAFVASL